MDRMIIRSQLSGFVLLDAIDHTGPETITGRKRFERAPVHLGIEALAQLGAFHVRFLVDFEKHAFLLGVKSCSLPPVRELNGNFTLSGTLVAGSSSAFSYRLGGRSEEGTVLDGDFLFALAGYDGLAFREEVLRQHYRKVFSCLRNGSKKNS